MCRDRTNAGNDEVFLADFNGDGHLDILSIRADPVYLGDGLGNFSADNVVGMPSDRYGLAPVAAGDIDGDGLDDVARISANGWPEAWHSSAPTVDVVAFHNASNGLAPVSGANRVRLADMNGDGRPELVVIGAGVVTIFKQTAVDDEWLWQQAGEVEFIGRSGVALATPRDLNHDGMLDLVWLAPAIGSSPFIPNGPNQLGVRCYNASDDEGTTERVLAVRWTFPAEPRNLPAAPAVVVLRYAATIPIPDVNRTTASLAISLHGAEGPFLLVVDGSMPNGEFQLSLEGLSGMPPPNIVHARVNVTSFDEQGVATSAAAVSQPITLVSAPSETEDGRTVP